MHSRFLLVKKTHHQGGKQTGMEEADRQLGLPRADWNHFWVREEGFGLPL